MKLIFTALMITTLGLSGSTPIVQSADPVVHAVLFLSPSCPHCSKVINDLLLPMLDDYAASLEVFGINTATSEGSSIYLEAIDYFAIQEQRQGVPTLIVGETVLVGSLEIPEHFPLIVDQGLSDGGIEWPDIPGLEGLLTTLADPEQETMPEPASTAIENTQMTKQEKRTNEDSVSDWQISSEEQQAQLGKRNASVKEKILQDPMGNSFSIVVLIGMIISLGERSVKILRKQVEALSSKQEFAIPVLCVVGLFIAGYLAYIETTGTVAVCGPVGDCNTVQQSEYATLFGFLPVGVLGFVGYIAILVAWIGTRIGQGWFSQFSRVAMLGMALFGVLFSMYLTFLEPFVIGATCTWCLSSAIIMSVMLWLAFRYANVAIPALTEALLKLRVTYREGYPHKVSRYEK